MKNLRDLIVLVLTIGLEIYVILLAGRYWGWNETTMNAWAIVSVLGLLVTSRYYAWWRH
jgi:hypothetical protein